MEDGHRLNMRLFWLVLFILDRTEAVWEELEKNTNSGGFSHRVTDTLTCAEVFHETSTKYAWIWRFWTGYEGGTRWRYLFSFADDVQYGLDRKKYSPDHAFDFWTECVQTTSIKSRKASLDSLSETLDHQ